MNAPVTEDSPVLSPMVAELLRMDPTLPCQITHKRALEEVFFTDFEVIEGGREFVLTAQLPRSHAFYSELDNGFHDLLLMVEIGRQGMTAYGHGVLGVPDGTAFVLSGSVAEVIDLEATRRCDELSSLVFRVPFVEGRRSARGRVRKYNLQGTGIIDGRPGVVLSGEALLIPSHLYEQARNVGVIGTPGDAPAPVAVEPDRVGRFAARNVVVGEAACSQQELRCAVVVDLAHPSFFDHPLDHVPAMLMLEAARQAAVLYAGEAHRWPARETVIDRCDARFNRYAALWPPVACRVVRQDPQADGAGRLSLRAHFAQAGEDTGYVDVRLRRVDD